MTYQDILRDRALADERLVVLTAENRALIRGLPPVLGDRFIDVGIAEQTMIGMAAGLALRGRIPVCHALAPFLLFRAYEFIRNSVAIPSLPVVLSGYIPGFLSDGNGPTHQALEDMSLMRGLPNMEVYCPADLEDLLAMLPHVLGTSKPAYLRITTQASGFAHSAFQAGRAEVLSVGRDVNIVVAGYLFREALRARDLLEEQGISTGLINIRCLKPLDEECLTEVLNTKSNIVTIEDHFRAGGLFTSLAELVAKRGIRAKIIPFAMNDQWFKPALLKEVLQYEGFTAEALSQKIFQEINTLMYVKFN
jgi:transketolase